MKYPKSYLQYATQYGAKLEVISHMLWDTQALTAATLQLTFFTAMPAAGRIDLSNMQVPGQLPQGQAMLVRALRLYYKQRPESLDPPAAPAAFAGAVQNVALMINTGALTLTIGNKQYGVYPLWALPGGGGPWGLVGLSDTGPVAAPNAGAFDYGNLGVPHSRNLFTLLEPLFIPPQMNFNVVITWAAALATLTRTNNLTVGLEGDLIRPVQ